MNPVTKMFRSMVASFNKAVDHLDHKYVDMIKQIFFLVIAILWITGLIFGVIKGRASALEGGIVLFTETNDLFKIHIRENKKDDDFRGVLMSEPGIAEAVSTVRREAAPQQEPLTPVSRDFIIEHERTPRVNFTLPPVGGDLVLEPQKDTVSGSETGLLEVDRRRNPDNKPRAEGVPLTTTPPIDTTGNPPKEESKETMKDSLLLPLNSGDILP